MIFLSFYLLWKPNLIMVDIPRLYGPDVDIGS